MYVHCHNQRFMLRASSARISPFTIEYGAVIICTLLRVSPLSLFTKKRERWMNGDTKLTPDSAVVCTFHIVNSTLNTAYIEIVMNDRSFPCFVLSTSTSIRTTVRLGMRKVKKDWKPGGRSRRHVLTGRRNCRNWRTYSYTSSLRTKAIALQSRLVFQQPRSYET